MPTVISLLRAVNVGRRQVAKAQLIAIHEAAGCTRPETVIASGNVVFEARAAGLERLRRRIEEEFERTTGLVSAVSLRTLEELREVEARSPFTGRTDVEPAKVIVTFLAMPPAAAALAAARAIDVAPDEAHYLGREIHVWFPNGMGRSTFPWAKVERALGVPGTGRNLNTVRKLIGVADARAGQLSRQGTG